MIRIFGCQQRKVLAIEPNSIEVGEIRIASFLAAGRQKVKHPILLIDFQ